ncbi:8131_t:CDS:2 [Entrophospora sp. SA101]|nr:5735_t:CDS:2 [Entrophospora sp. SA101]CAJ0753356.1 16008_t:CDS:2 [Entrophospora sp. SA101]CAJ0756442.1 8131_t:CDS:2 [Entrophospora sp. SA101]CAJ0898021.1 14007_t:CDS:2 [Entrophospora sp. SA101]
MLPAKPSRQIKNDQDLENWLKSEAFIRLMHFIKLLNENVANHKNSDPCHVSEITQKIVNTLDTMMIWIDENPPLPTPQRFGNKAFRTWINRLEQNVEIIHKDILPVEYYDHIIELAPYFVESFGNSTRIDYGNLVKKLQRVYMLEPAGSHGVWGLDDHQFLSYYWGSAQLRDHPNIKPKSILSNDLVDMYANEYIYFGCIKYINEVKKGPFHEHSPLLYDISGVPNWSKVNSGLLKMFVDEVMKKLPIVQHFLFGTLLPYNNNNH